MSTEERTLGTIDENVLEVSQFLRAYAEDKQKKECLKAFAECPNIVQWIKKIAKGMQYRTLMSQSAHLMCQVVLFWIMHFMYVTCVFLFYCYM